MAAKPLCAPLSPHREASSVLFSQPEQHPSVAASDLVSFGGSKCDALDDSMSLVLDPDELSRSINYPAPLPPTEHSEHAKPGMDTELIPIMSKAVEELGLVWSPPEEPICSRLDEWFLPGFHQARH